MVEELLEAISTGPTVHTAQDTGNSVNQEVVPSRRLITRNNSSFSLYFT